MGATESVAGRFPAIGRSGVCGGLRFCACSPSGSVTSLPSFGDPSPRAGAQDSYLVDSASSHMLVSKIKPCMSKYSNYTVKLRMAH